MIELKRDFEDVGLRGLSWETAGPLYLALVNQCSIILVAFHPYDVLFCLGRWQQAVFRHFAPYGRRPIWPSTHNTYAHLVYFSYIPEKLDIHPLPSPRVKTLQI